MYVFEAFWVLLLFYPQDLSQNSINTGNSVKDFSVTGISSKLAVEILYLTSKSVRPFVLFFFFSYISSVILILAIMSANECSWTVLCKLRSSLKAAGCVKAITVLKYCSVCFQTSTVCLCNWDRTPAYSSHTMREDTTGGRGLKCWLTTTAMISLFHPRFHFMCSW